MTSALQGGEMQYPFAMVQDDKEGGHKKEQIRIVITEKLFLI